MNIRRFTAENSRSALRQVREALGGDAIILANRSIEGGVEVLAAAPDEVEALTRRMSATMPAATSGMSSGMVPASMLAAQPSVEAANTPARNRLASLFARRTAPPAASTPTPAISQPIAAPAALSAYADAFAPELDTSGEDVVARLGPEAVAVAASDRRTMPVV
ncbi:MAG: hypothetical protein ACR2GP_07410, partial [Burkholderiaceae bacterium]